MISSDVIRGTIDLLIIDSLLDAPSYGYAISRRIAALAAGQYQIKETTLYSAMRRLEQAGLLESYKGDETQGRPRIYYRVTEAGGAYYQKRCAEWLETVDIVGRFIRKEEPS